MKFHALLVLGLFVGATAVAQQVPCHQEVGSVCEEGEIDQCFLPQEQQISDFHQCVPNKDRAYLADLQCSFPNGLKLTIKEVFIDVDGGYKAQAVARAQIKVGSVEYATEGLWFDDGSIFLSTRHGDDIQIFETEEKGIQRVWVDNNYKGTGEYKITDLTCNK